MDFSANNNNSNDNNNNNKNNSNGNNRNSNNSNNNFQTSHINKCWKGLECNVILRNTILPASCNVLLKSYSCTNIKSSNRFDEIRTRPKVGEMGPKGSASRRPKRQLSLLLKKRKGNINFDSAIGSKPSPPTMYILYFRLAVVLPIFALLLLRAWRANVS
jgi:hypothetical protein